MDHGMEWLRHSVCQHKSPLNVLFSFPTCKIFIQFHVFFLKIIFDLTKATNLQSGYNETVNN